MNIERKNFDLTILFKITIFKKKPRNGGNPLTISNDIITMEVRKGLLSIKEKLCKDKENQNFIVVITLNNINVYVTTITRKRD